MMLMRSVRVLLSLLALVQTTNAAASLPVSLPESSFFGFDNGPDDLSFLVDELRHRLLQQGTSVLQPDKVCKVYNEALANIMDCSCQRFGSTDVEVYCRDLGETCLPDGSSCYQRTVQTVLTSPDAAARVTTSCTNSTKPHIMETCVQIFPVALGDFRQVKECFATLNDVQCQSCSECAAKRNATSNTTGLTVNCCNVKSGAYQSCGQVGPYGSFLSFYDYQGSDTCQSAAVSVSVWTGIALVSSSILWLLLQH